jgi:hypothetical protein
VGYEKRVLSVSLSQAVSNVSRFRTIWRLSGFHCKAERHTCEVGAPKPGSLEDRICLDELFGESVVHPFEDVGTISTCPILPKAVRLRANHFHQLLSLSCRRFPLVFVQSESLLVCIGRRHSTEVRSRDETELLNLRGRLCQVFSSSRLLLAPTSVITKPRP